MSALNEIRRRFLLFILLILVVYTYFLFKDADPGMFKRTGDIGDGAAWAHEARNKILYGRFIIDDYNQAAAVGPLTLLSHYVTFSLFGVSIGTLALTTIAYQLLGIWFTYLLFKQKTQHALLAALVVAGNFNLFLISRSGMPLTLHGAFALGTFVAILVWQNPWITALCLSLGIAASLNFYLFLPVVMVLLLLLWLRGNLALEFMTKVGIGVVIFGILYGTYEYVNKDIFAKTMAGVTQGYAAGNGYWGYVSLLKQNLSQIYLSFMSLPHLFLSKEVFLGSYSPGNALMLFTALVYVISKNPLAILSPSWKTYLKRTDPLDLMLLSWLIIYPVSLLLFSDQGYHRFQLMAWTISLVSARVLTSSVLQTPLWQKSRGLNRGQQYVTGLLIFYISLLFSQIYFGNIDVLSTFAALLLSFTSMLYRHSIIITRIVYKIAFALFTYVLVNILIIPFFRHFLDWEKINSYSRQSLLIFLTGLLVYLLIYRVKQFTLFTVGVNLFLILHHVLTPTYSIKATALKIASYTSSSDYVVGPDSILMSMEGAFHPIWWIPNYTYGTVNLGIWNSDFVNSHKPNYLIYCNHYYGNRTEIPWTGKNLDGFWPTKTNLLALRAKDFSSLEEFKLFPYRGAYQMSTELIKVKY